MKRPETNEFEIIQQEFILPVYVKKSKKSTGGYVACFEKSILHIQGWGKTKQDAIGGLQNRLLDVLNGTRNPLV